MARNSPGGHNKVSYSQFSQFGSRKSRDDSNLLDPSGSISSLVWDSAEALRDWAQWIPFAAMRWIRIEWSLNGSKTQLTIYESYDINRTSGSDTDRLVWPLGMDAECRGLNIAGWTKPGEKRFCEISTLNLQDVTPFMRILHSARTTAAKWKKMKEAWTKTIESDWFRLDMQEFHIWLRTTSSAHTWSRAPKFSHLCGLGPCLVKMLPLTALDSPTIFFDWSKFCIGLFAICQSASWLLGIKRTHFPLVAFSTSCSLPGCMRGQGPSIFSGGMTRSSSHKLGTRLKSCLQIFTSLWSGAAFGEDVAADCIGLFNDFFLIGPSFASAYRNLSKRFLTAWHKKNPLSAGSDLSTFLQPSRLCERSRPKHFQWRNDKVSPEYCRHIWKVASHGRLRFGGGENFKIDLTLIMCTWTKITWVTWGNEVQSCSQWCSKMVESG